MLVRRVCTGASRLLLTRRLPLVTNNVSRGLATQAESSSSSSSSAELPTEESEEYGFRDGQEDVEYLDDDDLDDRASYDFRYGDEARQLPGYQGRQGSDEIIEKEETGDASPEAPSKSLYEIDRLVSEFDAITHELELRDFERKLQGTAERTPHMPEPVRDILMKMPKLRRLDHLWDKAELPEDVADTDFISLNRALRAADYDFFNDGWPEKAMPQEAFEVHQSDMDRVFEQDRQKRVDDLQQFLNSLTDLVLVTTGSHARVTKEGLVNSHSALIIGGNGRGWVGWGRGKSLDFNDALWNAKSDLRKNMIYVPRFENRTLFQKVVGKHNNTQVFVQTCRRGFGRTAGRLTGHIFEAAGIADVSARVYGGVNPYSVVYATFNALAQQVSGRQMARERGTNYYTLFEPAVKAPKAMTYREWRDQCDQATDMLKQSAADITRKYAVQEKLKIRSTAEQAGVTEYWDEKRAPKRPTDPEDCEATEVTQINPEGFHKSHDPVGKWFLPQYGTPRAVPKPLPRRDVY